MRKLTSVKRKIPKIPDEDMAKRREEVVEAMLKNSKTKSWKGMVKAGRGFGLFGTIRNTK